MPTENWREVRETPSLSYNFLSECRTKVRIPDAGEKTLEMWIAPTGIAIDVRRSEKESVNTIEHSAMTRQRRPRVFHADGALEKGFAEITRLPENVGGKSYKHAIDP
jgi:hypothetical protein